MGDDGLCAVGDGAGVEVEPLPEPPPAQPASATQPAQIEMMRAFRANVLGARFIESPSRGWYEDPVVLLIAHPHREMIT